MVRFQREQNKRKREKERKERGDTLVQKLGRIKLVHTEKGCMKNTRTQVRKGNTPISEKKIGEGVCRFFSDPRNKTPRKMERRIANTHLTDKDTGWREEWEKERKKR